MFGIILDFVVSIYTVILCRLHRIFCGLEKYGVFEYIYEFFDVLHTTGHQYINHDIEIYLQARNAVIPA